MSKNQELHYKIKDLDLISKEFKHHSSCYKDLWLQCKIQDRYFNSAKSTFEETTPSKRTFDIKDREELIKIHVIRDHETVSMSQLQDVYGDKIQKDIYVRRNMKKKLVEIFGNKLMFIPIRPNTPDVVISSEAIKSTLNISDKASNC